MREKILMFYSNHQPGFQIFKAVLGAVLLTILVLLVNLDVIPLIHVLPGFLLTGTALAQSILSTLAGAWLTVTTFTFSTTMVVLTTYSSSYSPRIVENFLQQKTTMRVLGTFIGGFLYCISMLFFLNKSLVGEQVLSSSVAILYALWCVAQFVIFIFTVANAVQAQNLIGSLYDEAADIIDTYKQEEMNLRSEHIETERFAFSYAIIANGSGYLEAVHTRDILRLLEPEGHRVLVSARVGDFVRNGAKLATWHCQEAPENAEELQAKIARCFNLKNKRYTILDYRYSLEKIVDIALRAISPGINDPNTAISCINSLGLLTGDLAGIEGRYDILETEHDEEAKDPSEIVIENFSLGEDLFTIYSQIVHYGQNDLSIIKALLQAIAGAALVSTPSNRRHLLAIGRYIHDSARPNFTQDQDLNQLERSLHQLLQAVGEGTVALR
ncbi:MAG: DUF2254 domain-containing protein [Clostridiaceae bacterium]|nr:DUF2254 domain-containing protein [Clostridiaceae bacterium]